MYKKVIFYEMKYPLPIEKIKKQFSKLIKEKRFVSDKNFITKKISLICDFENKKPKDDNYCVGVDFEFQIRARNNVPWQKTRDLYGIIFIPKYNLMVVSGRDQGVPEFLSFFRDKLYIDAKNEIVFKRIQFTIDSVIEIINKLKKDDKESWCDEYRGKHESIKYQDKKTKSNFSLGEGNCVLDDEEAKDAIEVSSSISPVFKYYKCPKLNGDVFDTPKSITFNSQKGSISFSISQDFDNIYKFIINFFVDKVKLKDL